MRTILHRFWLPFLVLLSLSTWQVNGSNNSTEGNSTQHNVHYNLIGEESITITMIVSSVGVISNGLLVTAIVIDPLKRLRKGAWLTIFNLAWADLFASLGTFFLFSIDYFIAEPSAVNTGFAVSNVVMVTGQSASFFLLTLLTVEIFVVTRFPLRRYSIFTRKKIVIALTGIWFLSFMFALPNLLLSPLRLDPNQMLKIYIVWIAILELAVVVQVGFKVLVVLEILKSRRSAPRRCSSQGKHTKVAKTVIILNIILILTAFPYFVAKQIEYYVRLYGGENSLLNAFPYLYMPVAATNYVVNPFLYAWRIPDYRHTLLACFYHAGGSYRPRAASMRSSHGFNETTVRTLSNEI